MIDSYHFNNFDDDVKFIIGCWIPIIALAFKLSISIMKLPTQIPNIDRKIVDFLENIFIERQLWVHQIQQRCQVNHWKLFTRSGVVIKSIYIRDEVNERVTKNWQLISWLLLICLYQGRSVRKSFLSLHYILFEVIIMIMISRKHLIICYALKKRWFDCCFLI